MNIIFDLDGTLIDSKPRLYNLFQFLVPESTFTFEEYWSLKKNKINHKEILISKLLYSEVQFNKFEKLWLEYIELENWLNFDTPFNGVTNFLKSIRENNSLYITTARQSKERTLAQIQRFGWNNIFANVLVTEHKNEKYELIKDSIITNSNDWIVGDTGLDIKTGNILGIRTAAVLSGFLSKESLIPYKPDIIINNILELNFYL
jgi:phosphoglycolate phosphatase